MNSKSKTALKNIVKECLIEILAEGLVGNSSATISEVINYDFNIFLAAGQSLVGESGGTTLPIRGITRQIADIEGNLIQPT